MADNPRIEELRRRVLADPASIAFAALAEEFRRAGRYREAIETCRTGLQRHPSYLSARVTLGRSLVEVGQFDEAREVLEHVLRAAPENLAAIRALAYIHERQGETPEALEHFRAAMQTATEDAAAAAQASAVPSPPVPVSTAKPIVREPGAPGQRSGTRRRPRGRRLDQRGRRLDQDDDVCRAGEDRREDFVPGGGTGRDTAHATARSHSRARAPGSGTAPRAREPRALPRLDSSASSGFGRQ